jgi:hypothetical protein
MRLLVFFENIEERERQTPRRLYSMCCSVKTDEIKKLFEEYYMLEKTF